MRGHEEIAAPDWAGIRSYYLKHELSITDAGANCWGLDPYQWEFEAKIRLTPIERWFWDDIRVEGVVMYPQYPIGRFFVDFANPVARIAIECDGAAWHQDAERDALRQESIEAMGWRVWRIAGAECLKDELLDEHGRVIDIPLGRKLLRHICSWRNIRAEQTRQCAGLPS
jgi:very-short-patch-repair endonuclease